MSSYGLAAIHFSCLECGEHVAVDEDCCCVTCGKDTVVKWCSCVADKVDERYMRIVQVRAELDRRGIDVRPAVARVLKALRDREEGVMYCRTWDAEFDKLSGAWLDEPCEFLGGGYEVCPFGCGNRPRAHDPACLKDEESLAHGWGWVERT